MPDYWGSKLESPQACIDKSVEKLLYIILEDIPKHPKTPQAFENYTPWKEWRFFHTIKVHAMKVPIDIKKGPSNPSLANK